MDIEGSVYTAELLSLRYPLSPASTTSPCSSTSLLLSSPWTIPPSPPSSSSLSSSPPAVLNEGTLLSLSSSSPLSRSPPSSFPPGATSPELLATSPQATAVIFTTSGGRGGDRVTAGTALTLVDPVSPLSQHTVAAELEVAHAPGKSILCVHEQEHGDLIHFSTSNGQHNHVNGNAGDMDNNGATSEGAGSTLSHLSTMDASLRDKQVEQSHLELTNPASTSPPHHHLLSTAGNTDGNLFPTLILTAPAGSSEMIPMRLYASLTSVPTTTTSTSTIRSSILSGDDGGGGTCILMTPTNNPHDDLHHLVTSSTHHHHHPHDLLNDDINNNSSSATFSLAGFSSHLEHQTTGGHSLGTAILSMEDYGVGKAVDNDDEDLTLAKLSDDFTTTSGGVHHHHGKLKDILMNGNSHRSFLHGGPTSATSTIPGDSYILRELEVGYNPNTTTSTTSTDIGLGTSQGHGQEHSFVIPKEEDDLEEQGSFSEALHSMYASTQHSQPFCTTDSNGDLILIGNGGDLEGVYSTGVGLPPTSVTEAASWAPPCDMERVGCGLPAIGIVNDSMILNVDDDEEDDDDLLEATEEKEDGEPGAKGELKCKFCGFVCCSKSSLGIHERRHTGERPFACKYCGRLFNSAQCCKHHERLHTGDKPFQCSYCGKKYAVSTRLKRHERVHTREEPYKCTECNKTFRWFDAFRDHRNTHSGVPLYLCSVCGKTFTSYLKFYYHERGHLMKKERDRDRLAKQRQAMNGGVKPLAKPVAPRPIPSRTIDILKSLQQNSSACIMSPMFASSQLPPLATGRKGGSNKGQQRSGGKGAKK